MAAFGLLLVLVRLLMDRDRDRPTLTLINGALRGREWTEKAERVDGQINVESSAVTTLLRMLLLLLIQLELVEQYRDK